MADLFERFREAVDQHDWIRLQVLVTAAREDDWAAFMRMIRWSEATDRIFLRYGHPDHEWPCDCETCIISALTPDELKLLWPWQR